jgi:hypothetical protein
MTADSESRMGPTRVGGTDTEKTGTAAWRSSPTVMPPQWEAWLAEHHAIQPGVWLEIAKKGSDQRSVTPAEALEVALCYGWIDSQRKSHDGAYFLQKYSPRRRGSSWSRGQRRAGRDAGRRRAYAATRPRGDRGGQGGRTLGRGVRVAAQRHRPGGFGGRAGPGRAGASGLRVARADRSVRRDPAAIESAKRGQPGGLAAPAGQRPGSEPADLQRPLDGDHLHQTHAELTARTSSPPGAACSCG